MEELKLKVEKRDKKQNNDKLREEGFIPGVLYGEEVENTPIKFDIRDFKKIYEEAGHSSLVVLETKKGSYKVLIHDIARDPISGEPIHCDFYKPSTKKETTAEVPLVFVGASPAVKNSGGNLIKEIHSVEVKGLAQNLPKEIEVDVSNLVDFSSTVTIADIKGGGEFSILREDEDVVATVAVPREETEEEEAGELEEEAAAEKGEEKEGEESGEEEQGEGSAEKK